VIHTCENVKLQLVNLDGTTQFIVLSGIINTPYI